MGGARVVAELRVDFEGEGLLGTLAGRARMEGVELRVEIVEAPVAREVEVEEESLWRGWRVEFVGGEEGP